MTTRYENNSTRTINSNFEVSSRVRCTSTCTSHGSERACNISNLTRQFASIIVLGEARRSKHANCSMAELRKAYKYLDIPWKELSTVVYDIKNLS